MRDLFQEVKVIARLSRFLHGSANRIGRPFVAFRSATRAHSGYRRNSAAPAPDRRESFDYSRAESGDIEARFALRLTMFGVLEQLGDRSCEASTAAYSAAPTLCSPDGMGFDAGNSGHAAGEQMVITSCLVRSDIIARAGVFRASGHACLLKILPHGDPADPKEALPMLEFERAQSGRQVTFPGRTAFPALYLGPVSSPRVGGCYAALGICSGRGGLSACSVHRIVCGAGCLSRVWALVVHVVRAADATGDGRPTCCYACLRVGRGC